ncbi:histone-lysine N-methyltransferase SMYD3 isoform X2 [Bacillus rossius redtenbacheri]|uniref:histone-lysine N-methyltransferase SMYD3 isoform X2 n=1 Tax=Bacillus rossius redtenbacheri TaxID=93214 RepID=UPI002FDE4AC6
MCCVTQGLTACCDRCQLMKCSGCQYVHYCGRQCQKRAWADHRTECVTMCCVTQGLTACCDRCQLMKCSGCQYVHYCGRQCQKRAWADHRTECANLKKVAPRIVPDAARTLARIFFKLKRGGDMERKFYSKTQFRTFRDLMSHYSDIKQDEKKMEHFASLFAVLTEFLGEENVPNSAELLGIYGRMCVNSFNISDAEMLSIGTGIYLGASVVDHSCDPNAVAVFNGTTINIRAVKEIPTLDWSKIFISYIDVMNFPKDRQKELQETYYFLCGCSRCKDIEEIKSMSAILCPNTKCGSPVPVTKEDAGHNDLSCPVCGEAVSNDTYQEYLEVAEFTQDQLKNMTADLDVCAVCLRKQRGLFHELDLLRAKVLDLALESCIALGQWEDAARHGTRLLPAYRRYYGARHPLFGVFLLKLAKISLYLGRAPECSRLLAEAQGVVALTHGRQHGLYTGELSALWRQCRAECASSTVAP